MSGSKGIGEVLSREDMMSFSTLDFENLSDPDLILALTMSTIPLVTDIQYKTNKLLGTLTSA